MDGFNDISGTMEAEYDKVKLLKQSERSSVFVVRRKADGERFIFRRFEGTGEAYKKLLNISCPNLPKIIAVEEDGGMTSVLEEYVRGDTLFYILKGALLSPEEAINVTVQLCGALSALHSLGIVHRDVKPENIILRGDKAVLIDFDASRIVDPEKSTDTRILGTTGYAPPEQYGFSQTDARSDIYSLGVVLNVMLTGEHPSVRLAQGVLGNVVQKCTMITPEKRYASVEEVAKALNRKKAKPAKLFAAAAAVLCAVIGIAAFRWKGSGLQQENLSTQEETARAMDCVEISGLSNARGESSLLPEDFYDYWDKSEIVTENIFFSMPGELENYVTYEFAEDVLTFTVGNVPAEEWEKAFAELPEGSDKIHPSIIIVPQEDVTALAYRCGNGRTYRDVKNQYNSGDGLAYMDYDPNEIYDFELPEIAQKTEETGEEKIAGLDYGVYYLMAFWETASGEEISRVLPYRVIFAGGDGEEEEQAASDGWEPADGIEVENWEVTTGKSPLLPKDFYDYWDKDELVSTDKIRISAPGNIENYLSCEFSNDVLNITIGEIPDSVWKEAASEMEPGTTQIFVYISMKAPSENVVGVAFHQGNGPTFKNLKNQLAAGTEIDYEPFDPETEKIVTNRPIAQIFEQNGEKIVLPADTDGIFYAVMVWQDSEGNNISQILPYRFTIQWSGMETPVPEENDEYWMDCFWEPVTDPERAVFVRENNGKGFSVSELEEKGLLLEVFEKPGGISASFGESVDMETLANLEVFVVPPDARARKEGESVSEWLNAVISETKYVGFKGTSTNVGEYDEALAREQDAIISANEFYPMSKISTHSMNLVPARYTVSGTEKIWFTTPESIPGVLLIDWYTADPTKDPTAKPAVREYFYGSCEQKIFY
ncbi:MAG: serine/threonine protein kinase [Oscillospiraceae bacterium]